MVHAWQKKLFGRLRDQVFSFCIWASFKRIEIYAFPGEVINEIPFLSSYSFPRLQAVFSMSVDVMMGGGLVNLYQ